MQTALLQPSSCVRPIRQNLHASTSDGVFCSISQGLGGAYLIAFFLAVGIGEVSSGLLVTVPLLAGSILQLVGPAAVRALGSYRRWVMACGLLQAAMYAPLIWAALAGEISAKMAFVISALFQGAGMACGPAWHTWMGYLVPRQLRAAYFSRRNRALQMGVLGGLVGGGLLLEYCGAIQEHELLAFAGLFAIAGVCRAISIAFLSTQSETPDAVRALHLVSPVELGRRLLRGRDGKLLAYMLTVQVGNFMAVAYLAAYLLKRLELPYGWYMTLMAIPFIVKTLALPQIGKLAKRYGPYRVLAGAGVSIVPLAALWGVADNVAYLALVQALSGLAWGAYELTTFLLFFETIREEERTSVLTSYNLANSLAIVTGSLLGGWLINLLGAETDAYVMVFGLSSVVQLLTLGLLVRVVWSELPATTLLRLLPHLVRRPAPPLAAEVVQPESAARPGDPPAAR